MKRNAYHAHLSPRPRFGSLSAAAAGLRKERSGTFPLRLLALGLLATVVLFGALAVANRDAAAETIRPLGSPAVSANTGEKPQSKVWFHANQWWAVLPSTSVSLVVTWLWRLEPNNSWTNVL